MGYTRTYLSNGDAELMSHTSLSTLAVDLVVVHPSWWGLTTDTRLSLRCDRALAIEKRLNLVANFAA
ncbi:MAG TPA: hypothetical protein PKA76_12845, partial [Pirellulaceae bacterium]|nr:hypothetical protein [Pirellulaceae bacterium]